ncbi:lantibiotic dehydratase [Tumebacillus sp. ITR2]|uniref:Lantibiotic dehydratase n=1 Tax=Tumebacillus amylolyticus TaxID=2801339 RepID=A0ABS1J9N2_9BACL|nr:lantibiotic dehydratase [Tumebacillus amylolyticus]MBL0386969.1 lantibiotic dehydratase [Tumebacillus amylolyticus]
MSERYSKAPYIMRRVAGMPLHGLQEMQALQTVTQLQELATLRRWLAAHTPSLVEALEAAVPKMQSDVLRNQLIRYKRDLFNGRALKQSADSFADELSEELLTRMREWENANARVPEIEATARNTYEQELHNARQVMQQLAKDSNFRKGVVLTSLDLHSKLMKYIQTPLEEQNARLRKVELTLTTVLTRTVMKTSPFSHFTAVGMERWTNGEEAVTPVERAPSFQSSVSMNQVHLRRVLHALTEQPEIRENLSYRLHGAIVVSKSNKLMLMRRVDDAKNRARVFKTQEAYVKLDYSPPLQHVVELLRAAPEGTLTYRELVDSFGEMSTSAQVEGYLAQLISLTVLEPAVDVPEQTDDLLGDILLYIDSWPGEAATRTREALRMVQSMVQEYQQAQADARAALLSRIRDVMSGLFELLGLQAAQDTLSLLFYEDALLKEIQPVSESRYAKVLEALKLYQQLGPIFDSRYRAQTATAREFVRLYGEDGVCTDTASFIHKLVPIHEQFRKTLATGALLVDLDVANDIDSIRILNELNLEFAQLLQSKWLGDAEVELTVEELQGFIDRIPDVYQNRVVSNDVFGQWVERGEDSLYVLNQAYPGLMTFYSRFLPAYEEQGVRQELQAYLSDLFEETNPLVEMAGVYGFNANLHGALTSHELTFADLPVTRRNSPDVQPVEWSEVSFVYDRATDRVMLYHPNIGKFHVHFFGSLMPMLIPGLTRLLMNQFSNSLLPTNLYMMIEHELSYEQRQEAIRYYPRLRIGSVVLSRRKWLVPRTQLPMRGAKEEEFEWFTRVQEWYRSIGLPQRVFVKLTKMGRGEDPYGILGDEEKAEDATPEMVNFTKMKPQYIDFANPLMVRVFGKLILDSQLGLKIEETLPDVDEVENLGFPERYVSETIIEISRHGRGEEA